jgi:hypothetical protein
MVNVSPALFSTVQIAAAFSASAIRTAHGGDIQFSGLYDPPSLWTKTEPSALIISTRVANGR